MGKLYFHVNVSLVLRIVYMHTVNHPLTYPSLNHTNCLNFIHIILVLVPFTHWVQYVPLMCVYLWVYPLEHGEPTRGHTVNREWFSILHVSHQEYPIRANSLCLGEVQWFFLFCICSSVLKTLFFNVVCRLLGVGQTVFGVQDTICFLLLLFVNPQH